MRPTLFAAVALVLATSGCAYLPPLTHQFNREDLSRLAPGRTRRADAERMLGPSRRLQSTSRVLVCEKVRSGGYFAIFAGFTGAAGQIITQRYRILLEFDSTGVLERREVEVYRREGDQVPGLDSTLRFFPAPTETLFVRRSWTDLPRVYTHLAATRDGALGAVDLHGNLSVWTPGPASSPVTVALPRHGQVRAIALDPDAGVAWLARDLAFGELPREGMTAHAPIAAAWSRPRVTAMALSQDGARLAAGEAGQVVVRNTRTGVVQATFPIAKGQTVVALAWSPDDLGLAALNVDAGEMILTIHAPDTPGARATSVPIGAAPNPEYLFGPPTLAFSPDGRWLGINRGTHVELWRVIDAADTVRTVRLEDAFLLPYSIPDPLTSQVNLCLSFEPSSNRLAASNGRAVVFELDGSRQRWRSAVKGPEQFIRNLVFDPADGHLVGSTVRGLYGWNPDVAK